MFFRKLGHVNNAIYKNELAKAQIEHEEPINVELPILHYAKLQMLELCNFFNKFCYVNKLEDLKIDTGSL